MTTTEPQLALPKPKLRWNQYSLRTLLVFVTLCAIPCSWLAVKRQQAKRERDAAAAFETLSGKVDWSRPSGPVWLRELIGNDLFTHVRLLNLDGTKVTDAGLTNLKGLSQLQTLWLDGTKVTDARLEHLKGLSHLHALALHNTKVTDAGLEHLRGLSQLQTLILADSQITDAGLKHLKGLSQFKVIDLGRTKVTDEGVKVLQQALPNCTVYR